MKRIVFLTIIFCVLLSVSCGIYTSIHSEQSADTDFSAYHTFAWLRDDADTLNSPYNNEIIRNNIRNYFGQSFAERGYSLQLDTPDVLLKVIITNQKKERLIIYTSKPHPMPYYYNRYYYGSIYYSPYQWNYYYRQNNTFCYPANHCSQKIEYVEGSITLNVIERKTGKLVWSGVAIGDIYDPAYIKRNIHPAVVAIMKKYPVRPVPVPKNKKINELAFAR